MLNYFHTLDAKIFAACVHFHRLYDTLVSLLPQVRFMILGISLKLKQKYVGADTTIKIKVCNLDVMLFGISL